jgi:hypothetical protein
VERQRKRWETTAHGTGTAAANQERTAQDFRKKNGNRRKALTVRREGLPMVDVLQEDNVIEAV